MARDLEGVVREVVVDELTPAQATELLRDAAAVERRAGVLKTLVARRAAEGDAWAAQGHSSAESWLGDEMGSGFGAARATLNASEKLNELPGLNDAARSGDLSEEQLKQLSDAATADNEQDLLAQARRGNTDQLRKACKRAKASARSNEDEQPRHDRAHRGRFHRSWIDHEGAFRYEGKTTAIDGARFDAAVAAMANDVFKEAWKEGRRESSAAYKLDALLRLVLGSGGAGAGDERGGGTRTAGSNTEVVIRVDAARLAGGEGMCETTSTGAIPVDEAIGAILAGAFTKIVLMDGVDVSKVAHVGRHIPATLKTAVMERDGYACVHCGSTGCLEIHHYRVEYSKGGKTEYWNLVTVCSRCHDLISNQGYTLVGEPGAWEWRAPP
jgi:hypothetical protein